MTKKMSFAAIAAIVCLICFQTGCDNDSSAQQTQSEFNMDFSGSFITQTVNSDTDGDGRPATLGTLEGMSNLGEATIQDLLEFFLDEPTGCPENNINFRLVLGRFVIRFKDTGDLLLGEWTSGLSCFDPETNIAVLTLNGEFTGGTGQFEGVSGQMQMIATPLLLTTTAVEGYAFGGITGTLSGTIVFGE